MATHEPQAKDECDFSPQQRAELGRWFREESVTRSWIRATSPKTNCSNSWTVPKAGRAAPTTHPDEAGSFPAYPTCAAGRPDHGSNGASAFPFHLSHLKSHLYTFIDDLNDLFTPYCLV